MSQLTNDITGLNQDGVYNLGEEVSLTAIPADDYSFYGWQDSDGNNIGNNTTYSQIVTEDNPPDRIVAMFTQASQNDEYTIDVTNENSGYGSFVLYEYNTSISDYNVVTEDSVTDNVTSYTGTNEKKYKLTAQPNTGYQFIGWYVKKGINWVFVNDEYDYCFVMPSYGYEIKAVFEQIIEDGQDCHITYEETTVKRFTGDTVNASSLYRLSVEYEYNGESYVKYLVSRDGPFQHTVHNDITVPSGTYVKFRMEFQQPSSVNGYYGDPYGDYLDVYVKKWTIDGIDTNGNSALITDMLIDHDMTISCQLVNCMMTIYVNMVTEGWNDSRWLSSNIHQINGVNYYALIGSVKKNGYFTFNPYPAGGYKCKSAIDENGEVCYQNTLLLQNNTSQTAQKEIIKVYPVYNSLGVADPTIPRYIYISYEAVGYEVTVEAYKHTDSITGGTVWIGDQQVNTIELSDIVIKSRTASYQQEVTVHALPFVETSRYKYSFDRWIKKKDGKYYEITDNTQSHSTSMTTTITESSCFVACFDVKLAVTNETIYHKPYAISQYNIPKLALKSVGLTNASVSLTIDNEYGDEYAPNDDFYIGILAGQIPLPTHDLMEQYPDLIFDTKLGAAINPKFVNSHVDIPIDLDLKPDTFYIVRPYMYNSTNTVYGECLYILTDILPHPMYYSSNGYGLPGLYQTMPINGRYEPQLCPYVRFSSGNLQYRPIDNKWRFAENQWDFIGDGEIMQIYSDYNTTEELCDNTEGGLGQASSQWKDYFGWGTSGWYYHGDSRFYYEDINSLSGNAQYSIFNKYPTTVWSDRTAILDRWRGYTLNSVPWSWRTNLLTQYNENMLEDFNISYNTNNCYYWWNNEKWVWYPPASLTDVNDADDWFKEIVKTENSLDDTTVLSDSDWILWNQLTDDDKIRIYIMGLYSWSSYKSNIGYLRNYSELTDFVQSVVNEDYDILDKFTQYPHQTFSDGTDFETHKFDTRWYLVTPESLKTSIRDDFDDQYNYGYGPGYEASAYYGQKSLFGNGYSTQPASKYLDWGYVNRIGQCEPSVFRSFRDYIYNDNGNLVNIVSNKTEAQCWLENTKQISATITYGRVLTQVYGRLFIPANWRDKYFTQEYFDEMTEVNDYYESDDPYFNLVNEFNNVSFENYEDDSITLTSEQMTKLSYYGVLFLPNAGFRISGDFYAQNTVPAYWTGVTGTVIGNIATNQNARDLLYDTKTASGITSSSVRQQYNRRYVGKSVRLVKNAFYSGVDPTGDYIFDLVDNDERIASAHNPDIAYSLDMAGLIGSTNYTMFKLYITVKDQNGNTIEYNKWTSEYGSIYGSDHLDFEGGTFTKISTKQNLLWISSNSDNGYRINKILLSQGACESNNYIEQPIYGSSDVANISENLSMNINEFVMDENADNPYDASIVLYPHKYTFAKVYLYLTLQSNRDEEDETE